jgi:hypothetical protein
MIVSQRVPAWVWAVLVAVHVLALGWALRTGRWAFPDSDRYVQAAQNLQQHGELYARPWPQSIPRGQAVQEFTIRTVGYPVAVLAMGGAEGRPILLLLIQNVVSLLIIGSILHWWAGRVKPGRRHWMMALLCVLTFPAQLIYANAVMSEVLLQAVVMAMTAFGLAFLRSQNMHALAGVAGCAVAALLLKPVFYPLAVAVAGVGVIAAWRMHKKWLAIVGGVPLVVVGLYMGWNQQRTGYLHFSSITDINLLHYNAAGVVRQLEGPQAEEAWVVGVLREAQAQPSFAARQQLIQIRAGAVLRAHPVVYARQHVLGMATLFLDPGRFDVSEFLGLAPLAGGGFLALVRSGGLWQAIGHLPLGLLTLLGVLTVANLMRMVLAARGFWRLRKDTGILRQGRWIALGLLGYVALLTGPLGAARFLVPVWPLLFALALFGIKDQQKSPTT